MHRTIAAILGTMAVSVASANAADMPVKAPPIMPLPVQTWTGFYAGVNLGGAWANRSSDGITIGDDTGGVIGGGQLGYNWQTGAWLLGIEGDFQGSSQRRTHSFIDTAGATFETEGKIPWFATLRGRLGYVSGPWLLYATGGGAWVNFKASVTDAAGVTVSDDTTRSGWTVGGGVEWMFIPQWSAKVEYLYISTDHTSLVLDGDTFDRRIQENVFRAGVNYHF